MDNNLQKPNGILITKDYITFQIKTLDYGRCLPIPETPKEMSGCLPGDEIIFNFSLNRYVPINISSNHSKLVGILELTSKTRYGLTSRGHNKYLWRPMNPSYPPFIVASSQKDMTKNMLCSINLKNGHWNPEKTKFPEGEICEYFGQVGDWKAERKALLTHWCPHRNIIKYTHNTDTETNKIKNQQRRIIGESFIEKISTFHIDPQGCKDVDDILTMYENKDNTITCIITIADVAAQINNPEIIKNAQMIGSTFYDENGYILNPMIPSKLTEEFLSLNDTGIDKYGLSLLIEMDDSGIKKHEIFSSIICANTVKTFTYENFLKNGELHINNSVLIYKHLEKALGRQGTNYSGYSTGVDGVHAFVETTMLYYNWYIGNLLASSYLVEQTPFRSQQCSNWIEPSTKFSEEKATAKYNFGSETKHAGLGLSNYCHASSPIRRFCDLWIQYLIHLLIENNTIIPFELTDKLIDDLNTRNRAQKKFRKQLGLIAEIEKGNRNFTGICLEWIKSSDGLLWKGKFLVKEIGTIYTIRQTFEKERVEIGCEVPLQVGVNLSESIWKKRFVFVVSY